MTAANGPRYGSSFRVAVGVCVNGFTDQVCWVTSFHLRDGLDFSVRVGVEVYGGFLN